jgi:hypothetical protein
MASAWTTSTEYPTAAEFLVNEMPASFCARWAARLDASQQGYTDWATQNAQPLTAIRAGDSSHVAALQGDPWYWWIHQGLGGQYAAVIFPTIKWFQWLKDNC